MSEVLKDLSDREAVLRALDANMAGRTALYEGYRGGPQLYRFEDRLQVVSEVPHPIANQVYLARFSYDEADEGIARTMAPYREKKVPCHWWIGPTSRPADLASRLERAGFRRTEEETGMAAAIVEMQLEPPLPEGVEIRKVRDQQSLEIFFQAFRRNGLPEPLNRQIYELYKWLGFGEDRAMQQFVALLNGEPVATSAALYAHGVVGLYNVGTFPAARGRGIGTAISAAAFREAAGRGYNVAIVVSTPMGRNVYKRLGFQEVCRLSIYEWRPPDLA